MNKNSYTDVDLNRVFPQLNKYCNNKNENTLLSKSSTNHHCKELSKYLFYFKNFTKGKDDIHFKNMFVDVRLSNISYHIKSLMNDEPLSYILKICKEFDDLCTQYQNKEF